MTTNISLYTQGSHQSNNKLFQLNNFITQQLSNSFNSATLLTQQLSNSITQQLYTMNSKDYIYKLIEEVYLLLNFPLKIWLARCISIMITSLAELGR